MKSLCDCKCDECAKGNCKECSCLDYSSDCCK